MADLQSIEKCVQNLSETSLRKIDILINNAAFVGSDQRSFTK
jgi:short-subunit dehydrogenase